MAGQQIASREEAFVWEEAWKRPCWLAMNPADLSILQSTRLFAALDAETLQSLLAGTLPRGYPKGQLLFQHGEPADAFYVVLDGWVKVFRATPSGEEAVFGVFARGETFAEAALFLGDIYPASAEVVEDARLLCVRGASFRDRLQRRPEICLSMLATMSLHLHQIIGQVEQLQTRSSAQRLADFLLGLCPVQEGSAVVTLPYDKSLIASRLGMKPESLSRALSRLKDLGVNSDGNRVVIADIGELVDYCEARPLRMRFKDPTPGRVGGLG